MQQGVILKDDPGVMEGLLHARLFPISDIQSREQHSDEQIRSLIDHCANQESAIALNLLNQPLT